MSLLPSFSNTFEYNATTLDSPRKNYQCDIPKSPSWCAFTQDRLIGQGMAKGI